jgi:hypothetical protein
MQFVSKFHVLNIDPNLEKPNADCMYHHPHHNDQAHIAEQFHFIDDHTTETSRLAYYKINSYKLALTNNAYCASKDELQQIINNTLLNYVTPDAVLCNESFFESHNEN